MTEVFRKCEICGSEYNIDSTDTENLCHSCYLKKHDGEGWYGWLTTGSGRIEILAPIEKIRAVAQSGDNQQAVEDLMSDDFVSGQLYRYSDKVIFDEYEETGLNTDKMSKTRFQCEEALIWSLCWDFVDGGRLDELDEYEDFEQALRLAFVLDMVQTVVEYDVDCHREYEVLRYESLKGQDIVYMAEYVDDETLKKEIEEEADIYELTTPIIADGIKDGKIKLFWKHNI